MVDLIRLGAYRVGTDSAVDKAIHLNEKLEPFLQQRPTEFANQAESFEELKNIMGLN
jgi:flagellum-specific ATP synthase